MVKLDGNDSLDTLIRKSIVKDPYLSFSRAGDSSVQWFQLLRALDQQDLPGWPLLTQLKVQMQKCEKCSQEFCSLINYRRHLRVHHRLKRLNKDSTKNRVLLGDFWDKLSVNEAKEIVSFENVTLEEVLGSSIVKALSTLVRKPGFSSLSQVCLRAGSALLDIVQGRQSRFPISSQELFNILDDASERTFLCGAAALVKKYVFDGDARKIGLETRNLVACTSFLLEEKLVKAWIADKDAEALRFQKLLMEEEEAAQRRQSELLERKRQKKLRQKEQKAKDQRQGETVDVKESDSDTIKESESDNLKESDSDTVEAHCPAETCSILGASDFDTQKQVMNPGEDPSSLERLKVSKADGILDDEFNMSHDTCVYKDTGKDHSVEQRRLRRIGRRHKWQDSPKSQRHHRSPYASKLGGVQKHGTNKELKASSLVNGKKVWSRKIKLLNDGENPKTTAQDEAINRNKNYQLLIGSISVTLGNCSSHENKKISDDQSGCLEDHDILKKNKLHEKSRRAESCTNRTTIKLWRPVSRNGSEVPISAHSDCREIEADVVAERNGDINESKSSESSLRSSPVENSDNTSVKALPQPPEKISPGSMILLNSQNAKAFLAQRWKAALAGEHVKLVLPPEPQIECEAAVSQTVDIPKRSGTIPESVSVKPVLKSKLETGVVKMKYIQKQRIKA